MYLNHGSRAGIVDGFGDPRRPPRCATGRLDSPGSPGESEPAPSLWSGRTLPTPPGRLQSSPPSPGGSSSAVTTVAGRVPASRRGRRCQRAGSAACYSTQYGAFLRTGLPRRAPDPGSLREPRRRQRGTLVSEHTARARLAPAWHRLAADRAQAFTTGAVGATLSSVEIISGDNEGDDMAVSLCTVDSSGYPTSSCTALTAPSSFASGTLVFTDPASTTLAATTTYTLLITSPGGESLRLTNTSSDAEETGAAAGWTIANTYHIKNSANVWGPGGFTTSFLITIKAR